MTCPEHDHKGRRCGHAAGHRGCCATWTAATQPGRVDNAWWPRREPDETP